MMDEEIIIHLAKKHSFSKDFFKLRFLKDSRKYYILGTSIIKYIDNSGNKTLEDEFYIKQLFCCVIVHNFCIEDKNRLINLVSTYTYIFYCND